MDEQDDNRHGSGPAGDSTLESSKPTWSEHIGSVNMSHPQNNVAAPADGGTVVIVTVNRSEGDTPTTNAQDDDFIRHPSHSRSNQHSEDLGRTARADHEIYSDQLLTKKRGYPLWVPGPGMQLAIEYRRQGISIGDVGIVTSTGAFDFLFNIFHPADHPINHGIVPPGFSPFSFKDLEYDIQKTMDYGADTFLASSSVRKTSSNWIGQVFYPSQATIGQRFESTATEAAILIMPKGAKTHNLLNTWLVRQIVIHNAKVWYQYAKYTRGRNVKDGDIRVVVGFDKVTSWGMATSSCNTGQTASFVLKRDSTHVYRWDCIGGSGKVGPQKGEIDDLRVGDNAPQNQCVFVRTLNFTVAGEIWDDFPSAVVQQLGPGSKRFDHRDSASRGSRGGPNGSSGGGGTSPGHPSSSMPGSLDYKQSVKFDPVEVGVNHPSAAVHNCLHERFPDATMVITEDMDWISVLNDDDVAFPEPEDLCERILKAHKLENHQGIIHLVRKDSSNFNLWPRSSMGVGSIACDEAIYSSEISAQQLSFARRQLDNGVVVSRMQREREREAVDEAKRRLVVAKMRVDEQKANNWRETNAIRTLRQADIEVQQAVIKREKGMLAARERQVQMLEDQRRRNRTVSEAFIEDSFATLSARAVVDNLTNPSSMIRRHAMKNISICIGGIQDSSLPFSRFTPQDIAPELLPKLRELVSPPSESIEAVVRFAEGSVSAPPMAKALALAGQCTRLGEYLIETNESVSRLAICCLRQMVRMETSVVQPAYDAMAVAIPQIPIPGSPKQPQHPSIDFVKDVAPKIIADCFDNGVWSAVAPLVRHHITSIQVIALRIVVLLAGRSDRNRQGIIENDILGLLDADYQSSSPPPHVVEFFVELLPLVSERQFRRFPFIEWLLKRLSDPNPKINASVIDAFRKCVVNNDPAVFQLFAKVDLLRKLDKPPIQHVAIIELMCRLLPVLAIPYAQAKAAERIVPFLDHRDPDIATACLSACTRIVESTLEDRTHLFFVVSKLSFAKESTLKFYARAMPAFCKDWAASGNFKLIVQHMQHSEQRIRRPAQQVWYDIVCNSTIARSKIVHDDILEVVFDLCDSQYDDTALLGARCCSQMAIEITKAGVPPTQKLVALLGHPDILLRQAALRGIQSATESSAANCKVILEAGGFKALHLFFETNPIDVQENAHKILTRLAPFLLTSPEACAGLLQLLESTSPTMQHAARNALLTISNTNRGNRETLRAVVLNRLEMPTQPLIDYAVKAIQGWIGPDLADLKDSDFPTFFGLLEHSDRHIQNAALISLKQKLPNPEYEELLEKANIIHTLRSLSNSDNPEALNFVTVALRALALSLARNGHASNIIGLLVHKEPKVRDGAAVALEAISSGSPRDRKLLLEEDIIERLVNHEKHLEQTQIQVLASIVPLLALDYLDAGKVDVVFRLVDHPQQQIRSAASKAIAIVASGPMQQKTSLRDALLARLDQASSLLREVAATCLSRSLAHDLVVDGDFTRIFRILHSEDARLREPIIAELQAYIQESNETGRRRLVGARILPEILQAYTPAKDDLLDFMSGCLLPTLGPYFTQDNGGATLFPLLTHHEHGLRVSAIKALRNAIDSGYGNEENMAKAVVIGTLHSLTTSDDLICDLWCHILPKVAPYLANRAEIDILFKSLNDVRGNVREAASEAIWILARTSETSRSFMLPSLLHNLENPSRVSIPCLAQAISLSGSAFVSLGKEAKLLYLILNGKDVGMAAVEATIQLLSKGSSFERQQLVKANPDVLTVALTLHDRRSHRHHSLKLLHNIVTHLSYTLLVHEELAGKLFSLFDDPDPGLSKALYETWWGDPRVSKIDTLPELLPLLFHDEKLRNPSVVALLQELAPAMVPQLLSRRKLNILVQALMIDDVNVVQSFLQETRCVIENSNENEKRWFVAEPSFVSTIGEHLRGHDPAIRLDSSTIIRLLSAGSALRSGRIVNEGIGRYLSWIAVNGQKGAQQSSLRTLYTLLIAAPAHAAQLVEDSLPALCDILEQEDLFLGVYTSALRLLTEIVEQSPHSDIIDSGIVVSLVRWSSVQYSVTDTACKEDVFLICQLIAQQSDAGRQALIDAGILPELSSLTRSQMVLEVISACKILKSLAHTGTFRQHIISAGLETSMKHITSLIRKSTLQNKEERQLAQAAAKEVLETLKTSKRHSVESLYTQAPPSQAMRSEQIPRRNLQREPATIPGFDIPALGNQMKEGQSTPRGLSHSQSFSEPAVVRSQLGRLSAIREDRDIPDSHDSPQRSALVLEEERMMCNQAYLPGMSRHSLDYLPSEAVAEESDLDTLGKWPPQAPH